MIWIGKQLREDHVNRDSHTTADVAFTNLDVLDFGCIFGVPFSTAACFNLDKLDLNGADGCVLHIHKHAMIHLVQRLVGLCTCVHSLYFTQHALSGFT